jgi:hypothetical protein
MAKTKKKTAPQKATAKKVSAKKVPVKNKQMNFKIDKSKLSEYAKSAGKVLALLLVLLLVDLFVQYLNNDYSVAIVNGQRIPRREYVKNLETIYGAQVADALVEEELVRQLGQKEGIEIESEDVDEAYTEIETQLGGEEALNAALVQNNMTEDDLRGQLENELVLKKIIEPKLEYTDEDLADFFEQYKDMLYEDPSEIDFEEKRDEIESYYIEQKTFEERDIILGEFQEESTIKINVPGVSEDDTGYGFFKATRNLIANFTEEHNTN